MNPEKKENKFKHLLTRILNFIKKNPLLVIFIILVVGLGGYFLWDIFSAAKPQIELPNTETAKKEEKPVLVRAPISGRMVEAAVAAKQVVTVVIENHSDARPQSGLNEAAMVIETFAEGGITRFLAIYQDAEPKEIGPVRSAREYFVEWAKSYSAPFAHVGGNYDALQLITKLKVYDLNQFSLGSFFWRDNSRYAPHNVYTTYAKLILAAKSKNYPTENKNVPAFVFKDDAKLEERPVAFSFTVNFNPNFAVTWTYDPQTNNFMRSMLGVVQKDRITSEQIRAKNVIVAFSDFSYGTSAIGEQKVNFRTMGSGTAAFFIDGLKTAGTWKRNSDQIMRFYDASSQEIKLNGGTTWVEFAPIGTAVN